MAGNFNKSSFDWQKALAKMIANFALDPIIGISIGPDWKNNKKKIIYVKNIILLIHCILFKLFDIQLSPSAPLFLHEYTDDEDKPRKTQFEAYFDWMLESIELCGGVDDNSTRTQITEMILLVVKLQKVS